MYIRKVFFFFIYLLLHDEPAPNLISYESRLFLKFRELFWLIFGPNGVGYDALMATAIKEIV